MVWPEGEAAAASLRINTLTYRRNGLDPTPPATLGSCVLLLEEYTAHAYYTTQNNPPSHNTYNNSQRTS